MNKYYQKDLYKILEIQPSATTEQIKTAYRKQARIWHPDLNENSQESIVRFKEITEAYEVLTDSHKRSQYDILKGFNTYSSRESTYTAKAKEQNAKKAYSKDNENSQYSKYNYEYATKEDFNKSQNTQNTKKQGKDSFTQVFENILEGIFTGSSKSTNTAKSAKAAQKNKKPKEEKRKPENGRNINLSVNIKMHESINGTNRTINVLHSERCTKCEGRRFINGEKCTTCKGTGEVSHHKKLNVRIPAGVKNGAKIRIANEGNRGYYGGKDGDLYLLINIEESKFFKYDGLNVLCEIPITPYEAALGTNIDVPTLCGNVSMKIPPKTTSGQKFRLSNQGVYDEKTKKRGDQIVTVKIEIPKELSQKEIELYEQLKRFSSHNIRENLTNE